MNKFIAISLLSGTLVGTTITPTKATGQEPGTSQITPYVNWSGKAYLTTSAYSNVTSSNNIFNDSPLVTNDSGNAGTIVARL